MVARGRVRNGVVELPAGVRLAEGQEVVVAVIDAVPADSTRGHGVLDIPVVHLGAARSDDPGADLLGEMLEGRS